MRRTPRPIEGLNEPHYRVSDVAAAIGVHSTTVLRWIHTEKLDAKRGDDHNGMFVIPRSALAKAKLLRNTTEDQPEALPEPAGI